MEKYDEILEEINAEFKEKDIPHIQRTFLAISRLSQIFGVPIYSPSKEADYIHEWFKKRAKPSSLCVGSLFEAVYYYDAEFWSVHIPIVYGTCKIDAFDSFTDMPKFNIDSILNDNVENCSYIFFWTDCVDFAYGMDDLQKTEQDSFGFQLLCAGLEELNGATSSLLSSSVNKRAIMSSRMALEMFMKSFLAYKDGLDEKGAKKFSHDLNKTLNRVAQISHKSIPKRIYDFLQLYPSIQNRYLEQNATRREIAVCYYLALSMGAFVIRSITSRNIQEKMFDDNIS